MPKPYRVANATLEHAAALAPIMRRADRAEVYAASGLDPLAGLKASLDASVLARCWLVEDQPACIFGLATESLLSGTGRPWMLTSDFLRREQGTFLRHCRSFLAEMRGIFPVLTNWVDARYIGSIKWLQWMGFRLYPAEPFGPFGMLFHRFEMRGFDVAGEESSVSPVDPRVEPEGDNLVCCGRGAMSLVDRCRTISTTPRLSPLGSTRGSMGATEERKVVQA